MKNPYLWLIPALSVLVLSACASNRYLALQGQSLEERVNKYNDLYRWREYDSAANYLLPSVRRDFLAVIDSYRHDLNVEDYVIKDIHLDEEGRNATVVVARSFFKMPSVSLQQEEITQHWVRAVGEWYLSGPPY
ncbi:MAG: hypothetical protein A2V67_18715 [Deltaproteobacteria bacterium RBG_13_61_14]|nr:MAG: hypothetical protein A2V67_18715 [Deltaproteobacteria bacterium RBG_13_61_14]